MQPSDAVRSVKRQLNDNPIGMGVAAAALGSFIAMAVSESRWEREHMGPYRDARKSPGQSFGKDRRGRRQGGRKNA